jgi:FMN phosphatase YigB (HAD superfamily)
VQIVSHTDNVQLDAVWPRPPRDPLAHAITTSEDAKSSKPHAGIFQVALEKAGNPPPESVVFVGDSLWHDVAGANALGMTSVLLGAAPPDAKGNLVPSHVIENLAEVLDLVEA